MTSGDGAASGVGSADGAADARRAADLRRMKTVASGLLLLCAAVYVLTTGRPGLWGYVNATAEAAMVGAVADWFAVTALFRHPLGLRVPHTAIIPTRKDALGRSLEEFVSSNFLSVPVVRERVARADPAARVGQWLARPENAARVSAEVSTVTASLLRSLRDDEVAAVLDEVVVRRLAEQDWAPTLGRVLGQVVSDGTHHRLVDLLVHQVHRWLSEHRDVVRRTVLERAPAWSPRWVDERVAARAYGEVLGFVADVRADPGHRVRRALDDLLVDLAGRLRDDAATRDRAERLVRGVLRHAEVQAAVAALWSTVRRLLLEAVEDADGELRRRAAGALTGLGARLASDRTLASGVNGYAADAVAYVVERYRGEVTAVISETVRRWDATEASRRIELHVGRDLQFIRVNGTVVGGLVGLAIHTATVALT